MLSGPECYKYKIIRKFLKQNLYVMFGATPGDSQGLLLALYLGIRCSGYFCLGIQELPLVVCKEQKKGWVSTQVCHVQESKHCTIYHSGPPWEEFKIGYWGNQSFKIFFSTFKRISNCQAKEKTQTWRPQVQSSELHSPQSNTRMDPLAVLFWAAPMSVLPSTAWEKLI